MLKKYPLRALRKIKRLLERRRNRVNDYLHKLTIQLSRLFPDAVFIFEDLNKRKMYKNKHHNRRIDRANWSGIIEKLSYKSIVILVNPAYTSTTCPICGSKMESQEGQVVYYSNCVNSFNRQLVGCFNIFRKGLGKIKKLMGGPGVASTGAEVSLGKLMTPNPNVVYYVDYNGKYLKCL